MRIVSCRACPLGSAGARAVPGEGPANSKIMIVGEAPGANEEKEGRPFVGRGGKLLRNALNKLNINDPYITNIIKHRPPENRRPTQEEVQACSTFLRSEISIVKPSVILALGRTAIEYFGIYSKLSDISGRIFVTDDGIKIVACYHPAAVLRNPNLMPKFTSSLEQAKKATET